MKKYSLPKQKEWDLLAQRPTFNQVELTETVDTIIKKVKKEGDQALQEYTNTFDGVKLDRLIVSQEEINLASKEIKILLNFTRLNKSKKSQLKPCQA